MGAYILAVVELDRVLNGDRIPVVSKFDLDRAFYRHAFTIEWKE
jgi:hypothetical protein